MHVCVPCGFICTKKFICTKRLYKLTDKRPLFLLVATFRRNESYDCQIRTIRARMSTGAAPCQVDSMRAVCLCGEKCDQLNRNLQTTNT